MSQKRKILIKISEIQLVILSSIALIIGGIGLLIDVPSVLFIILISSCSIINIVLSIGYLTATIIITICNNQKFQNIIYGPKEFMFKLGISIFLLTVLLLILIIVALIL